LGGASVGVSSTGELGVALGAAVFDGAAVGCAAVGGAAVGCAAVDGAAVDSFGVFDTEVGTASDVSATGSVLLCDPEQLSVTEPVSPAALATKLPRTCRRVVTR
jgi:hypothetical protein